MFVGHFALALGSKREAPSVSLGWFIAAVTALDLVWPVLLIAGIEKVSVELSSRPPRYEMDRSSRAVVGGGDFDRDVGDRPMVASSAA